MAVNIDWSLLGNVDVGQKFQQGYQQGRQQRIEQETGKALEAYANNPDDPASVAGLARYNPQLAIQIQQDQRTRAAAAQKQEQEQRNAGIKVIGNAALQIKMLPPEQQPQAWDAAIDGLSAQYPGLANYRGKYSPQALDSVLAESGMTQQAIDNAQVRITPTQAGGSYVVQNAGGQIYDPAAGGYVTLGAAPQPAQQVPEAQILQGAAQAGIITPEDAARIQQSLGPNGQGQFQQWMQQNRVVIGKQLPNGQTAYLVNGEWYDNPEGR